MRKNEVRADHELRTQCKGDPAFTPGLRRCGGHGKSERIPGGKPTVEDGGRGVADPPAKKPQSRRKHIRSGIVGNDLRCVAHAALAQEARKGLRIGQRMAAVLPGLCAGQILLDSGEEGAWYVRFVVEPPPERKIG
jgi:hypothetical protein